MGKLRAALNGIRLVRAIPASTLINQSPNRAVIERDIERWVECVDAGNQADSRALKLAWLLAKFPEFRNLLNHRLSGGSKVHGLIAKALYKGEKTLHLVTKDIGPGLFIQHGFATIVAAESIGDDCWINQQVTVGHVYDRGAPKIGNNVTLAAGSHVIGPVTIGDQVTVGAGTTITKDVPAGAKAVGLGFRILLADDPTG
jgi:serine O-acetyltransferase